MRLLNGRLLRSRCFQARGVLYRAVPAGLRQRAALRIPKLRAMLESDKPLRLKPSTMRGKMERRARHEAALQRNLRSFAARILPRWQKRWTKRRMIRCVKVVHRPKVPASVANIDLDRVRRALFKADGNVTRAAKSLKVSRLICAG